MSELAGIARRLTRPVNVAGLEFLRMTGPRQGPPR